MLTVWVTLQKTNRKIIFSLAPVVHNLSHYYITNKSLPLFLGDRKICKKKKRIKSPHTKGKQNSNRQFDKGQEKTSLFILTDAPNTNQGNETQKGKTRKR